MLCLVTSICLLTLGVVLNLPAEAAILNTLWAAYVVLAHLPKSNPKSKLTSKSRPTYTGRALS